MKELADCVKVMIPYEAWYTKTSNGQAISGVLRWVNFNLSMSGLSKKHIKANWCRRIKYMDFLRQMGRNFF